jgi:hypothetical protein
MIVGRPRFARTSCAACLVAAMTPLERPQPPPSERDAQLRYAVLESQVRIATVTQGLDPTIGYLHVY